MTRCQNSYVKLAAWARRHGIQRHTAYRWFHAGQLPVPARQLPTGTILVDEPLPAVNPRVALYARVSSHDQKADLDRQMARLVDWAMRQGLEVARAEKEIDSALNSHRPRLLRLLGDPALSAIVVEHRDRLGRFGTEYLEAALRAAGRRVLVVEDREVADDLVRDMLEVLTAFCARLYGRRSATRRAQRALAAATCASPQASATADNVGTGEPNEQGGPLSIAEVGAGCTDD